MPRIFRLRIFVGLLLLTVMLASGCYRQNQLRYIDFGQATLITLASTEKEKQRPLLIAVATVQTPQQTINSYREVADYISRKIGRPAILIQRRTYEEVNVLLSNGEVDLAFLSTGAYSSYRGMSGIELLVMGEYKGTTLYNTGIIVPKDSNYNSLADLQGKVFAFTDPLSYSGHMVVESLLRQQQTVPELFFRRYFYTYSHDKSLWAVANRLADGASLDSQIIDDAREKTPELAAKIRVIASIGPAPTGPVVVKKSLSAGQKALLQQTFLEMHQATELTNALKTLLIDRFVPPEPALYEPLQRLYNRTELQP
jgi:phosphonate transport system substrate-binding protein